MFDRETALRSLYEWNLWGEFKEQFVMREDYIRKIHSFLSTEKILLILGVRRSGKSALTYLYAKWLIEHKKLNAKNFLFINFEDSYLKTLKENELKKLFELYLEEIEPTENRMVVLDEVHNVKGWEHFARTLSETSNTKIIITDSNSAIQESEYFNILSGRFLKITTFPLGFKEFLYFNDIKVEKTLDIVKNKTKIMRLFKEYLHGSGFPKYVLRKEEEILQIYFETILYKDIIKRHKIKEVKKTEALISLLVSNISTVISQRNLAKTVKLSQDSVDRFIEYFEDAYLFYQLPKFYYSKASQLKSIKKVYIVDNGFAKVVGFNVHKKTGQYLENLVFITLFKKYGKKIFYFKNKKEQECDFIIHEGIKNIKEAIQVTTSLADAKTKEREITGLLEAMKELNIKKGKILTYDQEDIITKQGKKITIMPTWKWLLEK